MMELRSTETHDITLKNLTLFLPRFYNSLITNHIARFGREQCCRIFDSNDTLDQVAAAAVEDFNGIFWS